MGHPVAPEDKTNDISDYFGSATQQALLMRGRQMFDLTRDDPATSYYGRTVGLASPDVAPFEKLVALTRLQGYSSYLRVDADHLSGVMDRLRAAGLTPGAYDRWEGGATAIHASQRLARAPLPKDLTLVWIRRDTPASVLASFGTTALDCGVLPPSLAVLTGDIKPGCALVALDPMGEVVSMAAAASILHSDCPGQHHTCWWGMLATRNDRRGAGLSMILGAQVLLEMNRRYGFTHFFTGVAGGNAASAAVCQRMGLERSTDHIVTATDTALVAGKSITK